MLNNLEMDSGAELTDKQAGEFLGNTEFFWSEENKDKFSRGIIKVYEGSVEEMSFILDTETNETIFYNHRT